MATRLRATLAAAACLALTACASTYSPESLTGGFSEKEVSPAVWWVSYAGNGYTTAETVQTYWLYHCAQVALAKGYDGFRILSPVKLTSTDSSLLIRVDSSRAMEEYARNHKPWLAGNIQLLRRPFIAEPGKVFDARGLKALLEPYVTGPKCEGNVCPHVHSYLFAAPTT